MANDASDISMLLYTLNKVQYVMFDASDFVQGV